MGWTYNRVVGGLLLAVMLPLGYACSDKPGNDSRDAVPLQEKSQSLDERGKYLVSILGCTDCHTPMKMGERGPEPDMNMFLAGHPQQLGKMPPVPQPQGPWIWFGAGTNTAFAGPWGVTYAINLTPDQNTGMGIWTEEVFIKAMRTGKHFGTARPIQPPMPWQAYSNLTDEDLKAVYSYLRTIRPISNRVPDYEPPTGSGAH